MPVDNARTSGEIVKHYELLEVLGRGGVAVVHKAKDLKLNRIVALKFLNQPSRDEENVKRFVREAQTASGLVHTNICTVYDIDETDDGRLFIVMAFCDGKNLKSLIEESPLPVDQSLDVAAQVCEALRVAHERGVIHRDIKPANIMVDDSGVVTLLDFGIAKDPVATPITAHCSVIGTAAYMSPEQASGRAIDHRCDIWSLGVSLYEMLTGKPPFSGENVPAIFSAVMDQEPTPIRKLRPEVPAGIERIVSRCMAKDLAGRPQNAGQLLLELRDWQTEFRKRRINAKKELETDQVIRGNLRSMELTSLLEWLSEAGKNGTLLIDDGRVEKKIVFGDGIILSTASTDPREFLGHFLVAHGFITELDLTRAVEMQEATGDLLGKNLVKLGAIGEHELERMLLLKAEETIYEIFAWDEGEFSFVDGLVPAGAMIPMTLNIQDLIAEASRRAREWVEISEIIPSNMAIPVTMCDLLDDSELSVGERQIIRFIDDRNTVAEICLFAHASEYHACRVLFRLWESGRVKIVVPRVVASGFRREIGRLPEVRASVVLENARQRLDDRDYAGALRCLQAARSLEPDNEEVKQESEELKTVMHKAITEEGLAQDRVPALRREMNHLTKLDLSPQEGYILSRVDGRQDIESLLKISPIPPLEALVVLWKLWSAGQVELQ